VLMRRDFALNLAEVEHVSGNALEARYDTKREGVLHATMASRWRPLRQGSWSSARPVSAPGIGFQRCSKRPPPPRWTLTPLFKFLPCW